MFSKNGSTTNGPIEDSDSKTTDIGADKANDDSFSMPTDWKMGKIKFIDCEGKAIPSSFFSPKNYKEHFVILWFILTFVTMFLRISGDLL